ncbi:MAG: hypothetical protein ACI8TP_004856 [Acidimicrobiales bacterium]|jgi:hypothetical protein
MRMSVRVTDTGVDGLPGVGMRMGVRVRVGGNCSHDRIKDRHRQRNQGAPSRYPGTELSR